MEEILHQLRLVVYPIIYSFLTSQVVSRISFINSMYIELRVCVFSRKKYTQECRTSGDIPSLKLAASLHLKMDGWNTIVFFFGWSIFRRAAGLNLRQKHRFFPNKNAAQHLGSSFEIDFVIASSNISNLSYYSRYLGSIAILRFGEPGS